MHGQAGSAYTQECHVVTLRFPRLDRTFSSLSVLALSVQAGESFAASSATAVPWLNVQCMPQHCIQ